MANFAGYLIDKDGNTLIPNGIETITNDNGTALKFSDGTMICYGKRHFDNITTNSAWGALYECANEVDFGVFPIDFISEPKLFLSQHMGSTLYTERIGGTSTSNVGHTWFWSPVPKENIYIEYNFLAIGRWK